MPHFTLDHDINLMILFAACGFALWVGGGVERLAAVLIFLDWILSPFLEHHDAFHHTELSIFALDGVLMLILLGMALKTNRYWPLWVTAFQILELLMHVAMLIDHGVRPRAYFIGMEISSDLMLGALAAGAWLEGPRRRFKGVRAPLTP